MRLSFLAFLGVLFLAYAFAKEVDHPTSPAGSEEALVQEVTPATHGARVVRRAQGGGGGGGGGGHRVH